MGFEESRSKFVNLRVEVYPDMVGPPGAEKVLIERVLKDHSFVRSAVILRNDGFSRLIPDASTRRSK